MKPTFASFAFGCRVNEAEKIKINQDLIKLGFVYSETNPQFYLINSCAVTEKAEREVRQFVYQIRKKFPKTKIILTGCAATLWMKNKNLIKEADLFIDNQDKAQLVNKIIDYVDCHSLEKGNPDPHLREDDEISFPDKFLDSKRLLIKIQDGCQRYCTYCIVPYLRGKPNSKTIKQILNEIKIYPDIKEIILSAINTEYFGLNNDETLIDLIETIIKKTNIPRVSFGSIHPWSITNKFIEYYKSILPTKRLINYFHIPLQSGSDKILKLMNRNYSTHRFIDKSMQIKKINPTAFIGTDIICGFIGETEKEFTETYNLLKESSIDKIHVFKYSLRPGTVAQILSKQHYNPNFQEKTSRSQKLIKLSKLKYQKFIKSLVGIKDNVLFLKPKTKGLQTGLLSNNVVINVKSNQNLCGQIKNVKITRISNHQLVGELI